MLELNLDGPVPLYYQLELMLRQQIEAGDLQPGEVLPSEHELAARYRVSRITIRRALDRLEEDGLIVRRRGTRTVIASNVLQYPKVERNPARLLGFEDEMRRLGLRAQARLLETTIGPPPPWAGALLEIPPEQHLVRIRRLGLSDGTPLWLESRYFPLSVGQALLDTDLSTASIRVVLERDLGLHIDQVEAHLEATIANHRQAELLGLTAGAPLLLNRSVAFSEGRPIAVVQSYLRADRYRIVLRTTGQIRRTGLALTNEEGGSELWIEPSLMNKD